MFKLSFWKGQKVIDLKSFRLAGEKLLVQALPFEARVQVTWRKDDL